MSHRPPDDAPSSGARGLSDAEPRTPRGRFLDDSPERVRELSAALGRLRVRDPEALEELRRRFDELAASAGSHGLSEIASRCVAARLAVADLEHRPLPLPRDALVTLEQHVLGVVEGFRIAQRREVDPGAA